MSVLRRLFTNAERNSPEPTNAEGQNESATAQPDPVDPGSEYATAIMYLRGEGMPKDRDKGMALLRKAAAQGHAEANISLGQFASRDAVELEKVGDFESAAQKFREAVEWFHGYEAPDGFLVAESLNRLLLNEAVLRRPGTLKSEHGRPPMRMEVERGDHRALTSAQQDVLKSLDHFGFASTETAYLLCDLAMTSVRAAGEWRQASWWWKHALRAVDSAVEHHPARQALHAKHRGFEVALVVTIDDAAAKLRRLVVEWIGAGGSSAPLALSPYHEIWRIEDLPPEGDAEGAVVAWGKQRTSVHDDRVDDEPVFAAFRSGDREFCVILFRGGQVVESKTYPLAA